MSTVAPRRPRRRTHRTTAGLLAGAAACAVLGLAGTTPAAAAPARPAGLVWTVAWTAPVTKAGPNRFDRAPELKGTAKYLLGGLTRVDYTITAPAGLPPACGTFPKTGMAAVAGGSFTVVPDLPCNATYGVSVVAQSGTGMLAARSAPLTAPLSLGDPGGAVGGARGAVDGASRTVSLTWADDADPDVTGYRIRRDGVGVADVGSATTTWEGTAPGVGTFTYDVQAIRWGDAGPGSTSLVSAPSSPLTARVDPAAPPGPVGGGSGSSGGSGSGSGSGSSGSGSGGSGSGSAGSGGGTPAKGSLPGKGSASASVPKGSSADAKVGPRSGYRSGGTISSSSTSAGEEPDVYEEKLPYEAKTSVKEVEVAGPDGTRTVSTTVPVTNKTKPGLLVPLAVVLVLLAASLQIRSLLGRARGESLVGDGPDLA